MRDKNIIALIGMTGAGKTTVGQVLAGRLNFKFLDLDLMITEITGKTPSEIFSLHGEEMFRRTETGELEKVFENYSQSLILSCGGGIVLKERNRELLKKNSFVVWLLRPFEEIIKNGEILKRPPINGDANNYINIFKKREKLYAEICDLKIECADVSESAERIINNFKNRS